MLPPQTPGLLSEPRVITVNWKCPSCPMGYTFPGNPLDGYFTNTPQLCPACGARHNPWDVILGSIKGPSAHTTFNPLGAVTTIFTTKIFLNTETRIDLHQHGLPKNAVILNINCT